MKQRIVVMNGYRIIQSRHAREWKTEKVDKAGEIAPGIYNLFLSTPADKRKVHKGVVLYVGKEAIYQLAGKTCVCHDRVNFNIFPNDGVQTTIRYESERALVATPSPTKSSRKLPS